MLKRGPGLTCAIVVAVILSGASPSAFVQSSGATLSGTVMDATDAPVPKVEISVANRDTGIVCRIATNALGRFFTPTLPPGHYDVTTHPSGFAAIEIRDIVLNVGDARILVIHLDIASVVERVTIDAPRIGSSDSAAVGNVVDREFLQNLPLNGRSLHALFELTPGIVLTQGQGQFSVNGQRDNANYFTIDGVGANTGISSGTSLGATAGGTIPAFSALGTTTTMVAVDAVEEFRVSTSTYAAEFGRTPGAQVQIVTRSGTNRFSGALFDYARNDTLDANDWFANRAGLPKTPLRQQNFGGTQGGPIFKDRTFYFVSYEGLRLRQPETSVTAVPDGAVRQTAPEAIQPFLDAYPVPNGPELGNQMAQFVGSYSAPSTSDALSVRIDHVFDPRLAMFGRYSDAYSDVGGRGVEGSIDALSTVSSSSHDARSVTVGASHSVGRAVFGEFRINYSRSRGASSFSLDNFGGAIPPADSALFPPFVTRDNALLIFSAPGAGLAVGHNVDNLQHQLNIVDDVSVVRSAHQIKVGIDYRRLTPVLNVLTYGETVNFSPAGLLSGVAARDAIQSNPVTRHPLFTDFSAYVQDVWRTSARFTLTAGVRWDVNPPPSELSGHQAYTVLGLENPATMTLAPKGTPLWNTSYANFAPRLGVAYQLSDASDRQSVLHGGFGVFYDLGSGPIGSTFGQAAFPYSATTILSNVTFPLNATQAQPPQINPGAPYGPLVVADPNLVLPRVYEWSVGLDHTIAGHQLVSVTYVGAAGRQLLRDEMLSGQNPAFPNLSVIRNDATSDYRALQLHYWRPLTNRVQAIASYTWAQSMDISSTESFLQVSTTQLDPSVDRGPSDFDVRHNFSAALTYAVPTRGAGRADPLLRNWFVDTIVRARSALPVNLSTDTNFLGAFGAQRPDVVPGVPQYLDDPSAPGGWRFNPAAFAVPPAGTQGSLGRNAMRGFPASQIDLSLRRRFDVGSGRHLEFRADVFNLFNHPNFADPDPFLDDPLFGESQSMLNQSSTHLSPLYQIGGPRSVQLGLKVLF